MRLPQNILVPIDLDDPAPLVLDYAVALAAKFDGRIDLLHVAPWPLLGAEIPVTLNEAAMEQIVKQKQHALDQLAAAHAGKVPIGSAVVKSGDARTVIATMATRLGADLIVMGTHGRRGVARLVLGSVAESVARTAPCPVLLVRSGQAAGAA